MKNAQKPDHVSLNTLLSRIREGRYVVPDFQREFEWRPWDIRELVRSIFLDYYIGSLLLWKGKKENFEALSCEAIWGHTGGSNREYIVLDGQQRLTALNYAFVAPDIPLPNRTNKFFYYVRVDKFIGEEYDEAFQYDSVTNRWIILLGDKTRQYAEHIFPVSVIGSGGWDLSNWAQGYATYWKARAAELAKGEATESTEKERERANSYALSAEVFGQHLKGITEQYQISYIELDRDLSVDKVCDIFTQINSRGVRLDIFDLINALLKPKGLSLKAMWRAAAARLEFIDSGKMNVYILQVMSILLQAYCSPKYLYYLLPGQAKQVRDQDGKVRPEILVSNTTEFEKRWQDSVTAIERSIKLLRHPSEYGAISSKYLPYASILPVFAALQDVLKSLPQMERLDAHRKFRHWYWASIFNNRYSGSVESTSSRDFVDMKLWFSDDDTEPVYIGEFRSKFDKLDLRREVKSGTSVYNGVFNLLILQGARDWITGNAPQYDDLDDHHIVPASWGTRNVSGTGIHTILNRTPLTSDTNRNIIRDRLPNAYLPELISANGESAVRAVLESHFISKAAQAILLRDPFSAVDFEAFVLERQKTILCAIEYLLIKERLDLSPQLRDIDEKIEQAELGLRRTVNEVLQGDEKLLPPHVLQKADERISNAARKSAAFDVKTFQTLPKKLEYLDLRELQDAISSRSSWELFRPRFVNKETLAAKFGQLAELRNGIRHSRSVDDITRKEGEAAIIWFQEVLKK